MTNEEELQKEQLLKSIRPIVARILDKPARERLNNVRIVKPDIAAQIELYLAQLYNAGQIKKNITEDEIIKILRSLKGKKEFKIRRL